MRLDISVPDMNDSFSRVVLDETQYFIRFTWNDTAERWSFGLYTIQKEPIVQGLRMIPQFPLNLQIAREDVPKGAFGVLSDFASVGRHDFINGMASFTYISANGGSA
jgi:hypothetical protein